MNPMMKKIATGTLAVGLLAGGAGVYYSQAFAATDSSAPAADSQAAGKAPRTHGGEKGARGPFGGDFKRGGGGLVEQTATVLGVEASVIRDELKQQKTLAQIALDKANLSEDAFLQKLLDAEKTKLTEQVTAGKLTQAQADERIAGLSERIQKEITAVGGSFDGKGGEHGGEKGARGPFGGDFKRGGAGLVEQTATVLGVEASVIRDELKQQKTLAQIALDKANLSEDAFLQKLLDAEKAKLAEQVTAGKLTQAQADEKTAGLSERIQKEITAVGGQFDGKGEGHGGRPGKGGFPGGGRGGFGAFGNPEALSSALGLTKDELSAALKEGKSLTEIAADKGIDKDQLVSKIKDSLDEPIRQFIDRKHTGKQQQPAPASGAAADGTSGAGA